MEDLVQKSGSILDKVHNHPTLACLGKLVHSCKLSIIGFAKLNLT